ncbi:unnamed protein product, partial [marine sediment metagenome]
RFFRAQDFSKKDNEEAEKLILKALEIYRRTSRKYKITECCEILVNMYIYSNDDLTLKYLEEGLRTSLEINNDLMISQFFRQYAVYHYSKGDIPQFLNYSKKMKEIYQRIDDKVGLGIAYRYVGEFYKLTNKWEEAYQELQKSYDIFKETDHNLEFAATQESLGDLFKIQGDLRKALKYYNQAHQLIADLNQYPWFVIENIAEIYFLMGDVDRSLDMHKELMERYEARSQKKGISDNLCKLG